MCIRDSPSVEKTDLPDEVQIKEELVADGSKTLQRNIILLGVAGFALLAGITLLVRKKQ